MEINKETIETMIIFLYKINETDACEELLAVYRKYFFTEEDQPKSDHIAKLELVQ